MFGPTKTDAEAAREEQFEKDIQREKEKSERDYGTCRDCPDEKETWQTEKDSDTEWS